MPIIDVYAHVSLPRFLSVDDLLRLMDAHDVECAVLSTAETCPDVLELSRAIVVHPDRLRAIGMPLGASRQHLREAISAQLESGFSGIRLPAAFVAENPDVLDIIGEARAIPLVVGEHGLRAAAGLLADFLDRYPDAFAIAGHFGGATDPAIFFTDNDVARLFAHPSLYVAMTRHGALRHLPLEEWAHALVARVGWQRLLWGSEWPVALWRNETYRSTLAWAERLRPSHDDLHAFRYGNAHRLFFADGAQPVHQLASAFDLMPYRRHADVWLFPPSLDISEERHRDLMLAYERWGGETRGPYSVFFLEMVECGVSFAEALVDTVGAV